MDAPAKLQRRMRGFAMALFLVAVYTVVIKFVSPIAYAIAEKQPAPIMWDFWWVIHVWLGIWLWRGHRLTWELGVVVSVVEIVIIVTKFSFFLRAPEMTFWRISWFINKCFVLTLFVLLLVQLLQPKIKMHLKGQT